METETTTERDGTRMPLTSADVLGERVEGLRELGTGKETGKGVRQEKVSGTVFGFLGRTWGEGSRNGS